MKKLILALFIFSSIQVFAQEGGTYYYDKYDRVCEKESAERTVTVTKEKKKPIIQKEFYFNYARTYPIPTFISYQYNLKKDSVYEIDMYKRSVFIESSHMVFYKIGKNTYTYKLFNSSNNITESGTASQLIPLVRNGMVITYDSIGNILNITQYKNNLNLTDDSLRKNRFSEILDSANFNTRQNKILAEINVRDYYFDENDQPCVQSKATSMISISNTTDGRFIELKNYKFDNKWNPQRNYFVYEILPDSTIKMDYYVNDIYKESTFRYVFKNDDDSFTFFDLDTSNAVIKIGTAKNIFPLIRDGIVVSYNQDGNLETSYEYENNSWLGRSGKFITDSSGTHQDIEEIIEIAPEFESGEMGLFTYLAENIRYPMDAKEKNKQGTVFVTFIISPDGTIDDIEVLRGVYPSIDNEALRVVANTSGMWKPGYQNGKPVRVQFNLPIKFMLQY
ncbi:MAG: energy transducer TonB [Bacteroidales bacterium]|nr:energy transducer TonB [Bacteroidales bacterium]